MSRTGLSFLQEHQFQWRVTDKGGNVENLDRTKWQEPGDLWRAEVDSGLSQLPHLGGPRQSKGSVTGELNWGKLGSGTDIPSSSGVLTGRES